MSGFFPAHNRRRFLAAAVEDTLRWCARPDTIVIGNHPTDQYWIQAFAPTAAKVSAATARRFMDTLKVINVTWDYETVAEVINELRVVSDFEPAHDIPRLAKELCRANKQVNAFTAVASKLSHFVFPAAEIYIWHSLSRCSVLSQEHYLAEYDIHSDDPLACDHEDQDYASFHAACRRILQRNMAQRDFVEASHLITGLLRAVPGPLADPAVPDAFLHRCLLDKLLFHEGWHLKYGRTTYGAALEAGSLMSNGGKSKPAQLKVLSNSHHSSNNASVRHSGPTANSRLFAKPITDL